MSKKGEGAASVLSHSGDGTTPASIVAQFNGGNCDRCGGRLVAAVYVGGDHDEIAYCESCWRHYGCFECER